MKCLVDEADEVIVTDTGSTDDTVKLLRNNGAIVHVAKVDPWRFDVARNISMQVVPGDVDVCVCIDLDEVLTPGWRAAIEKSWKPETTRMRYPYVWNTLPDGREGTTFWYDKIHRRNGYRWVKPVHEVLAYYDGNEHETYCDGFKLYHYPDVTKSRGSYLPLLELGCREDPNDDRSCHYLGREYMYYNRPQDAIKKLLEHINMPSATWASERAASMRYLGRCYQQLGNSAEAERWALRAVAEAPNEREPLVELGKLYYNLQNWHGAYYAMKQALLIENRPMTYINEPESWGSFPADVASVAAYRLGMKSEALMLSKVALSIEPNDERIKKNVLAMQKELE